jgi:pimeloyl-ACP methyl ester carboxylesterase
MNLLVSKGMVKTALGAIGYLICDGGNESLTPILCFHASPRCSDEFLEVLPILAATGRKVIALDVPGYGMSENPLRSCTIDEISDAFLQVAEAALETTSTAEQQQRFVTIGCLMGNFHAVSLASRYPERVAACICANLFYYPPPPPPTTPTPEIMIKAAQQQDIDDNNTATQTNEEEEEEADDDTKQQQQQQQQPSMIIPDSFVLKEDGSHLVELHNKRKSWLDAELNFRVVQGEIAYLVNRRARYAKGISIQDLSEYDFETPAKATKCPTLCVRGASCLAFFDAIGLGGTQQFEAGVKLFGDNGGEVASLEGPTSTINMINQAPKEFAALCQDFLEKKGL